MTTFHDYKTCEVPVQDVNVVDLTSRVVPHLSSEAVASLRSGRKSPGWVHDMVIVARMWSREPGEDDIKKLATDISTMVHHVDVDSLLTAPVLIPLQDARKHLAVLLVRVRGVEAPGVFETLRATLPITCGLHVIDHGELPPTVTT